MKEPIRKRVRALDWTAISRTLREDGYARLPRILTASECAALVRLYAQHRRFRSTVDMERHRFGVGEYRYFAEPLPRVVREVRTYFYPRLAPVANGWAEASRQRQRFPPTLEEFLALCRRSGQVKPTPLLLRYETGGYNCLHRDLYGEIAFPLQMTIFLSRAGADYEGGPSCWSSSVRASSRAGRRWCLSRERRSSSRRRTVPFEARVGSSAPACATASRV